MQDKIWLNFSKTLKKRYRCR